ncbi:hypothetical protein BGZ91_001282 [Linnemannia elongata]|nr:hypothetical protein BGZ91_001282 [Linnemannia elongata]
MTQDEPLSLPQEPRQAIRSIEKTLPLSSIPPANPDYTFYVDCHLEPDTQKGFVLWEDILSAFNNAVRVQRGAQVVHFLKGSDLRTLEPRRIAAVPNTVLDIVVDTPLAKMEASQPRNIFEESVSRLMQEDEESDRSSIASLDIMTTCNVSRNPAYSLEEMGNYSHVDELLASPPARGLQALLDDQPIDNDTLSTPHHSSSGYSSSSQGPHSSMTHLPMQKTLAQTFTSATNGDTMAQVALGDMYRDGKEVVQNHQAAMEWYLMAAEQGDPVGQRAVGRLLYFGLGVSVDHSAAMDWALKAANQGDALAQRSVGFHYREGHGVQQDSTRAMEWFLKAAKQGLAVAQLDIGLLYCKGDGVPEDSARAMEWFLKAANQGLDSAQYCIGHFYQNGYVVSQDYAQAMDWHLKAANQGYAFAQYQVGSLYHYGHGVSPSYAKAMTWYRKAADQGDTDAQHIIGSYYEKGYGVPPDHGQALDWYLKAAGKGHEESQRNIGALYQNGHGVPRNKAKAADWIQFAARQRSKNDRQRSKNASKVLEKLKENE